MLLFEKKIKKKNITRFLVLGPKCAFEYVFFTLWRNDVAWRPFELKSRHLAAADFAGAIARAVAVCRRGRSGKCRRRGSCGRGCRVDALWAACALKHVGKPAAEPLGHHAIQKRVDAAAEVVTHT